MERIERGCSLTLGTPVRGTSVLMMTEGLWGHLREASGVWEIIKGRQRNMKKHKGGRLVLGDSVLKVLGKSFRPLSGSEFLVTSDGREGSCHQFPVLRAENLQCWIWAFLSAQERASRLPRSPVTGRKPGSGTF